MTNDKKGGKMLIKETKQNRHALMNCRIITWWLEYWADLPQFKQKKYKSKFTDWHNQGQSPNYTTSDFSY